MQDEHYIPTETDTNPVPPTVSRRTSPALLYVSVALLAVPVLILGSSMLDIDESGLMTTGLFFLVGLPAGITGFIMLMIALAQSRKERALISGVTLDSPATKIIKTILLAVIVAALCAPIVYIILWFVQF